jgi:hypothetical protein
LPKLTLHEQKKNDVPVLLGYPYFRVSKNKNPWDKFSDVISLIYPSSKLLNQSMNLAGKPLKGQRNFWKRKLWARKSQDRHSYVRSPVNTKRKKQSSPFSPDPIQANTHTHIWNVSKQY